MIHSYKRITILYEYAYIMRIKTTMNTNVKFIYQLLFNKFL